MEKTTFHYQPICSAPHCDNSAVYKVAAPWSNGRSRELKSYGLACEAHRDSQLALAQLHRQGLKLAEGETIGPVGLYELAAGKRDAELSRLPDH
ncbi:hypothetical protein V5E97_21405 [Singulisphaera sp. Ch08]|uniref:Uncharacterized protein n=1 Tax=Singulisphaera sp. Ch08 TaxID=3120278 RepID=A0AAU7C6W2_9BACT